MKICAAQIRPLRGDIETNIEKHIQLIHLAVSEGADLVIFPELSITGYEPTLAKALATHYNDDRFDVFQNVSNVKGITIGVGMPIKSSNDIRISMIIFQPNKPRQVYAKQHLHADEYPYFACGNEQVYLASGNHKIALAICYELSVPEHAASAYTNKADIYIASVAKTATGVDKAVESLSHIAKQYAMIVVMSNCIGLCDGVECSGKTAAWNSKGELIGQLDDANEGLLIIDTITERVSEQII